MNQSSSNHLLTVPHPQHMQVKIEWEGANMSKSIKPSSCYISACQCQCLTNLSHHHHHCSALFAALYLMYCAESPWLHASLHFIHCTGNWSTLHWSALKLSAPPDAQASHTENCTLPHALPCMHSKAWLGDVLTVPTVGLLWCMCSTRIVPWGYSGVCVANISRFSHQGFQSSRTHGNYNITPIC